MNKGDVEVKIHSPNLGGGGTTPVAPVSLEGRKEKKTKGDWPGATTLSPSTSLQLLVRSGEER